MAPALQLPVEFVEHEVTKYSASELREGTMLGGKWERFAVDFGQKSLKIFAGKGPLEGRCTAFVVGLEGEESLLEFGQRREVVRGKDFSLNASARRSTS
jgi:hypothetical protein